MRGRFIIKKLLLLLLLFLVSPLTLAQHEVFKDGFEVTAPPGPFCQPVPSGFTVYQKTWLQLFYDRPWPTSPSFLTPVGSFSLRSGNGAFRYGRPAAGIVITTNFTTNAFMNKVAWVGAQPIPQANYNTAQAALKLTVSVSPCRADLYAACSYDVRAGNLFYGPTAADPKCRFDAFSNLWMTWHLSPEELNPLLNTCDTRNPSLGIRCDANFQGTTSGPPAGAQPTILDQSGWMWIP